MALDRDMGDLDSIASSSPGLLGHLRQVISPSISQFPHFIDGGNNHRVSLQSDWEIKSSMFELGGGFREIGNNSEMRLGKIQTNTFEEK